MPPPLIVYFLFPSDKELLGFHTSFYIQIEVPGGAYPSCEQLSPVPGENRATVKPSGTSLNISNISHELPTLRSSRGGTDLCLQPLDNVKVRSGAGILHPLSPCSRVPWARWNQSISNGRGHRIDTVRGTRAQPPSSTVRPDTHTSSYCRCSHLKNYTQLVLLFLPFLFLKHDFHHHHHHHPPI